MANDHDDLANLMASVNHLNLDLPSRQVFQSHPYFLVHDDQNDDRNRLLRCTFMTTIRRRHIPKALEYEKAEQDGYKNT